MVRSVNLFIFQTLSDFFANKSVNPSESMTCMVQRFAFDMCLWIKFRGGNIAGHIARMRCFAGKVGVKCIETIQILNASPNTGRRR